MKNLVLLFMLVSFLFSLVTLPQRILAQPSAEAQKMDVMVGEWELENKDATFTYKWWGDLTTYCEGFMINDDGDKIEYVYLNRYDPEAKVFTTHRFYSNGFADSGFTWVDGNNWTTVFEGPEGYRYKVVRVISEDTWKWKWYESIKGGPWELYSESSAKRVK